MRAKELTQQDTHTVHSAQCNTPADSTRHTGVKHHTAGHKHRGAAGARLAAAAEQHPLLTTRGTTHFVGCVAVVSCTVLGMSNRLAAAPQQATEQLRGVRVSVG